MIEELVSGLMAVSMAIVIGTLNGNDNSPLDSFTHNDKQNPFGK